MNDISDVLCKMGLQSPFESHSQELARLEEVVGFIVPSWYKYIVENSSLIGNSREIVENGIKSVIYFAPIWALLEEIGSGIGFGEIVKDGYFPIGTCGLGTGAMYSVANVGSIDATVCCQQSHGKKIDIVAKNIIELLIKSTG